MQLQAVFCSGRHDDLVARVQRFRKAVFVDRCGWDLHIEDGRESDEFDVGDAVHLALLDAGDIVGTFRATRTDRPYLAAEVFPQLALVSPYPRRPDVWEISRFGVLAQEDARRIARLNYALMFWFARRMAATGLVAIADLTYERFLRTLGIRTRRYGPPQTIGVDRQGRPLRAVAGEIPLTHQDGECLGALFSLLNEIEITDVSEIFGPARVSA